MYKNFGEKKTKRSQLCLFTGCKPQKQNLTNVGPLIWKFGGDRGRLENRAWKRGSKQGELE